MQMQLMLSYRPTSDNIVIRPIRRYAPTIDSCPRTIKIFYEQKMKFAKLTTIFVVFAITMVLGGCAELALKLPESEIDAFFKPNNKESGKATLYLICGKDFYNSWIRTSPRESDRICQYKINGEIYKHIGQDGVGRLDINPGEYVIKQIPEAGTTNSKDSTQILEMEAGDIAFCKADHSWYVGLFQSLLTADHIYPVECEKKNVLVQIKAKKPVRMEIIKATENHDNP